MGERLRHGQIVLDLFICFETKSGLKETNNCEPDSTEKRFSVYVISIGGTQILAGHYSILVHLFIFYAHKNAFSLQL